MTKRDIAVVACKMLAILLFVGVINGLLLSIYGLISGFFVSESERSIIVWQSLFQLIPNLLVIAVCVWLWFKAENITARFIADSSPGNYLVINNDFVPAIIGLVGIVIFTLAISSFFGVLGYVLRPSFMESPFGMRNIDKIRHMNPEEIVRLATAILQLAFGVILFFGANGISSRLRNHYQEMVTS